MAPQLANFIDPVFKYFPKIMVGTQHGKIQRSVQGMTLVLSAKLSSTKAECSP